MLKKEARKILCMLMTVAIVVSGIEVPVNATELTAKLREETVLEDATEEEPSEIATTQIAGVTESEEETKTVVESEEETILPEESEMEEESSSSEELLQTETIEKDTDAETDEEQELAQASGNIASGAYGNTKWVLDSTGKLTITGTGEYCAYTQHTAAPWYDYRDSVKTAVVELRDIESPAFMFEDCTNLTSVDISKLDTSKSRDFRALFSGCKSLKSIDLGKLDTSNATQMSSMFAGCWSIEQLDISNFNTGHVTDMRNMFQGMIHLKHITLGKNFKTDCVMNMGYMFSGCYDLQELDLSGFNTENVTYMRNMFNNCDSLTQLDVSGFNTSKVSDLQYMFYGCDGLRSLDLSSFDMGNVKYADGMVGGWMQIIELHTPCNVQLDISISDGTWLTPDGVAVTHFPKNTAKSIKLVQQMHLEVSKDVKTYPYGNALDLTDLTVKWMSSTGHINKTVTDYKTNADQIDMHTAGTKDLIITYDGLTATIKITVKPQTVANWLELENAKTVYLPGEKPALSDDVWLGIYEREDKGVITKNFKSNINEIDTSTPGIKKLKVSWEDGSGEIDLFVMEAFSDDDIANGRTDTLAYKIDKNGKLTVMGSGYDAWTTSDKMWGSTEENLNAIKTAKIVLRGTDDLRRLLKGCRNLESVDLSETDTGRVKNMSRMFESCETLKSLDLSGFHTENVTSMSGMFEKCKSLTSLDLSSFDTGNVIGMYDMFAECGCLESLDLSGFNTKKVQSMARMFYSCKSLQSLNLSSFDTRNATNMSEMFYNCENLQRLNISGFHTENVTDMNSMFRYCENLGSLNLASFHTGNVTNMKKMFSGCNNLASLNLSGFDTGNVTDMDSMFSSCKKLDNLNLSRFQTGNVTNMAGMFYNCESLANLDISSFDTGNVTSMAGMFSGCKSLVSLDLRNFDTKNVTNMRTMFYNCERLTSLELDSLDTGNVTDMYSMFCRCESLASLELGSFNTENVTDMACVFDGCSSLTSLELGSFNTKNVTDMGQMFSDCKSLTNLDLSSFDTRNVTNMRIMFGYCFNLKSLNLSSFDMGDITDSYYADHMFRLCNKLEELRSPRNVKVEVSLEKTLYDADNVAYKTLPVGKNDSIVLKAKEEPEEESSKAEESSSGQESSKVEESSETEENASGEESSKVEESPETEESSAIRESSKTEESAKTEESSKTEESAKTEESSEAEGTDLNEIGGKVSAIKVKTYDGNPYEPSVKVTVTENRKKITLTEGADYSIEYQNNVNAGEGTVIVRGTGQYRGTLTETFTIHPKSVKSLKAYADNTTVDCMSEPAVYIFDGAKRLENGTDYTLAYDKDLTSIGRTSADIEIVAKGNYKDSKTVKITVYDGSSGNLFTKAKLNKTTFRYTGKKIEPEVTVTALSAKGEKLEQNKDYKVQYQNNINAGTAYVIVTGKGQYKGKVIVPFEITPLKASATKLTIARIADKTYNGKLQKPSVTVKDGKKKLTNGKDYTITYTENLHASTKSKKAKVIITGKGNYTGITASAEFIIKPQNISRAAVKGTKENLTLTYNKMKLEEGVHYTVTPDASGATKNKIKIIITGLGDFAGSTVTKTIKVQ